MSFLFLLFSEYSIMHFFIPLRPWCWVLVANAIVVHMQALEVSSVSLPDHSPFFSNDDNDPMLFNTGMYELSEGVFEGTDGRDREYVEPLMNKQTNQ